MEEPHGKKGKRHREKKERVTRWMRDVHRKKWQHGKEEMKGSKDPDPHGSSSKGREGGGGVASVFADVCSISWKYLKYLM